MADELKSILFSNNSQYKDGITTTKTLTPKDNDKDVPLVEVMYPDKYFADIIIPKEKKETLEEIVNDFINWDVLVSNGVYPSRKILFYGHPGCGKTATAQAIACELGVPMLYVRFDAVVSSFLGETASNIRKVFEYAKKDNWVIFFDEFDAIGRSRNDNTEHGEIKRVVNTFLQQIDAFDGKSLVIAATNFEKSLDYAIWRRFDETVCFELPTKGEMLELFEINTKNIDGPRQTFAKYLDNLEKFTHSDIERVGQIIRKRCILDGRKLFNKKDIEYAIKKQSQMVSMRKTSY